MWNRKVFCATAWGLVLGLGGLLGAAHAESDGDEPGKPVIKKRVVIVDQDGRQKVWEGDGPLVRRGYFGVGLTDLTPELRAHFGVPEDSGVMISKVEAGSPAEKAGLKVGDILTRLDGHDIRSAWAVTAKARGLEEGQQVSFEVWRNGKAQTLSVAATLKERPELDMGPLLFKDGEGKGLMLQMSPDEVKGMVGRLRVEDGRDAKDVRFRRLATPREAELEKQLKALEKRIDDLEKQLKKQKG
jgi:membrane-associated protease RseP (regulator of RpoE activity)